MATCIGTQAPIETIAARDLSGKAWLIAWPRSLRDENITASPTLLTKYAAHASDRMYSISVRLGDNCQFVTFAKRSVSARALQCLYDK